jgi:hypothetical protein
MQRSRLVRLQICHKIRPSGEILGFKHTVLQKVTQLPTFSIRVC